MLKLNPILKKKRLYTMNQPEEHHSVNKIMLPFKGKAPTKQNMRVESHPQGVNLWDQAAWYPVQLWCFAKAGQQGHLGSVIKLSWWWKKIKRPLVRRTSSNQEENEPTKRRPVTDTKQNTTRFQQTCLHEGKSSSSVLLYIHKDRSTIRDREPGWPFWLSHNSWALQWKKKK